MTASRWAQVAGLVALLGLLPGRGAAQDEDLEARKEQAKAFANGALELMNKGLYDEALELFTKADGRFHSPVFVLYMSDLELKRGKLLAARVFLERVVNEQLAEYAPAAFRNAQAEARRRLAELDERIPTVSLTVAGPAADDARVMLDGKALASADLGRAMRLEPGEHHVAATTPGGNSAQRDFTLAEGDTSSVEVVLTSPVASGGGGSDGLEGDTGGEAGSSGGLAPWVPPAIAFGLGGAGLLVGAITGGIFVGQASDLEDACANDGDGDDTRCPADKQADGDAALAMGTASTVAFILGGVGVAAGVVLLVVPIGGGDEGPRDAYRPSLRVWPGGLGIEGRF